MSTKGMATKSILILTGVLCLLSFHALANKGNISKFSKLICKVHDNVLINNSSCRAKPFSRAQTLLNMYANVTYKIDVLLANIRLYKKFNVYRPFLVNVTENVCHYFSKESSVPYVSILMRIMQPYTNANHTCPFEGDIIFKNLPMNADKLRGLWPSGEYRLNVDLYANKITSPFVTMEIYLEMIEKI